MCIMRLWLERVTTTRRSRSRSRRRTRPGATAQERFRVQVPQDARPGGEIRVSVSGRVVRVQCPSDCVPGDYITFNMEVPRSSEQQQQEEEEENNNNNDDVIRNSVPLSQGEAQSSSPPPPPEATTTGNTTPSLSAALLNTPPQSPIHTPPRTPPRTPLRNSNGNNDNNNNVPTQTPNNNDYKTFMIAVPPSATPGRPFAVVAGGTRVLVNCPLNAVPGDTIRFAIPVRKFPDVILRYSNKDQWTRAIREDNYKFQWIRLDANGEMQRPSSTFDPEKSAYVRSLKYHPITTIESSDSPIRSGSLSLVPANEIMTASSVKTRGGTNLVSYSEIANAQGKNFDDKIKWFADICKDKITAKYSSGFMQLDVRRGDHLLSDSIRSVMEMDQKELRKIWRIDFIGEDAIDVGGVSREWFQLVFQQLFDPSNGLFVISTSNQACVTINTASEQCIEDHLVYFRFTGRMLGKALLDRQIVNGHFIQLLYKHILGWPIQFKDLEPFDEEYYKHLKSLEDMIIQGGMNLSDLTTDFTVVQDVLGAKKVIELVPGGSGILLSNENFPEYLDACLKYRLFGMFEEQLREILLGFYDIIPEALMAIFDFQELELLMCGLPNIDLEDWQKNTKYVGNNYGEDIENGSDHQTVVWFWEAVAEFSQEKKARLLQFVTGTSGVPAAGFGLLQGVDGNIRQFTIQLVSANQYPYPRAHTCFNRLDLPDYTTKEEVKEKLDIVVTTAATGFGLE